MRIVLLCPKYLDGWQVKFTKPLFESSENMIVGCVIDDRPPKTLIQKLVKNLKKGRGGYTLIMAVKKLLIKKPPYEETAMLFSKKEVPIIFTRNPYSYEIKNKVLEFKADLMILVGGFGIIKEPLLSTCPMGILSYHGGDMRKYRGQPGGFWEVYNGEREGMITVQRLSKGLDCGEPIVEKKFKIRYTDDPATVEKRIYEESTEMMAEAVKLVANKNFSPLTINEYGKIYTIPNFRQWLILVIKVWMRRVRMWISPAENI